MEDGGWRIEDRRYLLFSIFYLRFSPLSLTCKPEYDQTNHQEAHPGGNATDELRVRGAEEPTQTVPSVITIDFDGLDAEDPSRV